jgi:hypothetical protein
MWSLTSTRAKRIGGPEKFRPSGEKDFFNTICQKLTQASSIVMFGFHTLSLISPHFFIPPSVLG